MHVDRTPLEGLYVLGSEEHRDERGSFREIFRQGPLQAALGRAPAWCQANVSHSAAGVLRGFHAEPWDKLVDVTDGTALCAVADVRSDSPTFGEVATYLVGDAPGHRLSLFVAQGLANGFYAVTDVRYVYMVTAEWQPGGDRLGVAWDDPDLAVPWPTSAPVLSAADRANPTLRRLFGDHPRFSGR